MKKRAQAADKIVGDTDIDITPLIDCVFLLLIFFMITTVFVELKGLVVDLPMGGDDNQEEQQQERKDVNIFITAMGEYTVNGEKVASAALPDAIRGAMDDTDSKNVVIQGEEDTQTRYIIYAMDMATGQGAEQMAFAMEQPAEN